MKVLAALVALAIVAAIGFGLIAIGAHVLVLNVNDMLRAGQASFWPMFWILLTLILFVGGGTSTVAASARTRKR